LRFKISDDGKIEIKGSKKPVELPKLLTGHIDFVQLGTDRFTFWTTNLTGTRKPIEQLTWYA